jgi:uncharacterized protein (DUF1015 family)
VLIADGHHRYAISRSYRDEMRDSELAAAAATTMTYVAELVESQLSIAAIHRLYRGVDAARLLTVFAERFEIAPVAGRVTTAVIGEMNRHGALCLVDNDLHGWWLVPKTDAFVGLRDLDSLRLEHALRATTHEVAYQHGAEEVLHMMRDGVASAAVLIRPTSIGEIRRTAEERVLMPPKSTFFTPKLRTGLVLRPLDV